MTESAVMERNTENLTSEIDLHALSEQVMALTELVELLTQDQVEMTEKIESLEIALASSSNGDELVFQQKQDGAPAEDSLSNETPPIDETVGGDVSIEAVDETQEEGLSMLDAAPEALPPMPDAPADEIILRSDDAPETMQDTSEDAALLDDAALPDSADTADSGDEMTLETPQDNLDGPLEDPAAVPEPTVDATSEQPSEDVMETPEGITNEPEPETLTAEDETQATDDIPQGVAAEDAPPEDMPVEQSSLDEAPIADTQQEFVEPAPEPAPEPTLSADQDSPTNPLEALEERMMSRIVELTPPKEMIIALNSKLDQLALSDTGASPAITDTGSNFQTNADEFLQRLETVAANLEQQPQTGGTASGSDMGSGDKIAELISLVGEQKASALDSNDITAIIKNMQGEFLDDLRVTMAELTDPGQNTQADVAGQVIPG